MAEKIYGSSFHEIDCTNTAVFERFNQLIELANKDKSVLAEAELMQECDFYRKHTGYKGMCSFVTIPEEKRLFLIRFDHAEPDGKMYTVYYDEVKGRHYIEK